MGRQGPPKSINVTPGFEVSLPCWESNALWCETIVKRGKKREVVTMDAQALNTAHFLRGWCVTSSIYSIARSYPNPSCFFVCGHNSRLTEKNFPVVPVQFELEIFNIVIAYLLHARAVLAKAPILVHSFPPLLPYYGSGHDQGNWATICQPGRMNSHGRAI